MSYEMIPTDRASRRDVSKASRKGTLSHSIIVHIRVILRSLGLQIVKPFKSWRGPENPKIAIRQGRSVATARASVHFVPVAACLVILIYNFRVVFVWYDSGCVALQFVAKLHEVLMQASVAAIVLGYIRHHLTGETALPFGALLAGSQIYSASSLVSLEFWGTVTAPLLGMRHRIVYFILVSVGVLLGSTVGPASAILMLPRQMQTRIGSFNYFINETKLFPLQITASNVGSAWVSVWLRKLSKANVRRNLGAVEQFFQQDLPDYLTAVFADFPEPVKTNISYAYSEDLDTSVEYTVCSPGLCIPTCHEYDTSGSVGLGENLEYASGLMRTYLSKQPCFRTHCALQDVQGNQNASYLQLLPGQPSNLSMTKGDFLRSYDAAGDAHLTWLPPPESLRGNYSIIAVYAPHRSGAGKDSAWTCGLQAAWRPSRLKTVVDSLGIHTLSGELIDPDGPQWGKSSVMPAELEPEPAEAWPEAIVSIDPDWATTSTVVNSSVDGAGLPFAVTLQDLFRQLESSWSEVPLDLSLAPTVGTVVATAMSSLNASALDPGPIRQKPGLTEVKVEVFAAGTGYSITTVPDILAAVVLCLYCLFALTFMAWSLWTGQSSNSWDSIAELVALGLNSRALAQLKNTSAGVETMTVFQEPIRILENKEQSVEIVFENDQDLKNTHRTIKVNQAY
ncbi:hypothetical protein EV356DRAFT_48170 [Viridothelium virens]|uniref:Uncharacterized protein n=1 Tax=Viridothelium virens TaxID=1048519 RepID=A0A6A6GSI3_VIRVR|nr:hypothetical protein EV356DRAFT_48170 [Viridothelium virens]